jgi:hypothetical protein
MSKKEPWGLGRLLMELPKRYHINCCTFRFSHLNSFKAAKVPTFSGLSSVWSPNSAYSTRKGALCFVVGRAQIGYYSERYILGKNLIRNHLSYALVSHILIS